MKPCIKIVLLIPVLFLTLFLSTPIYGGSGKPSALLMQPEGRVEYSKDGSVWKKVRRNKFLFDHYQVRTGPDSACKILIHKNNDLFHLKAGTIIYISADTVTAVQGNINKTRTPTGLFSQLERKYARIQKYAVVQRSAIFGRKKEFPAVENIRLSKDYPDLVWQNPGVEYTYQLHTGNQNGSQNFIILASQDQEMIRFRLPAMNPGTYDYHIKVLKNGREVSATSMGNTLTWISDVENKTLQEDIAAVNEIDPGNALLIGNLLDERGLSVAAMDAYRRYFKEQDGDNEMRPFLIKIYHVLKLKKLKQDEINLYNDLYE